MFTGEEINRKRKAEGLSAQALADKLEVSKDNLYKWEKGHRPTNPEDYNKITAWLSGKVENVLKEPETNYTATRLYKKLNGDRKRTIPYYDAGAVGGPDSMEMTPITAPEGSIDVGDLLNDSTAAIRIYGNSMIPNYPPGCVVGIASIDSRWIEPGEVYVIETNDRRLLKRLFYRDDDAQSGFVTCYSDNTMTFEKGARHGKSAYPPFDIPMDDIKRLYNVTGVIKRNTNSLIINR